MIRREAKVKAEMLRMAKCTNRKVTSVRGERLQVRGDSVLARVVIGGGEKLLDSGYILKIVPRGFRGWMWSVRKKEE